jgi:Cu/Ag efflux protein CusF
MDIRISFAGDFNAKPLEANALTKCTQNFFRLGTQLLNADTWVLKILGRFQEMNRIQKIALSIFSAALLVGATATLPTHAASQATPSAGASQASPSQGAGSSQTQDLQSVSGKITSVSGKTFTLSTSSASPSSPAGQQFQASPSSAAGQSMTFTIDDNTTVSGKLAVGANADVTYRSSNGENIAVSVRVS